MPFCRSLCPCTFSKHLQRRKNGNKSTKIKSWMKCFVIFRLDCMSSSLSYSVNQSQRIIVWFAMIPPFANVFTTFLNPSSEQRSTRNVQYQSIWVEIGLHCNWWARIHTRLSILNFRNENPKKQHILLRWSKLVLISNRKKLRSINSILRAPLITAESLRFD